MRKFGVVFGLLIVASTVTTGFTQAPGSIKPTSSNEQNTAELSKVRELFAAGKYEKGLSIIHNHKEDMESLDQNGIRWLELFIKGSEETRDKTQLSLLFEFFPEIFKEHEQASLLVADNYIINNQIKDYKKVRSLWQDRETKVAAWFVLDVDQLLLEGKKQEAIKLLKSRSFKNKADVERLVRIALLTAQDDPKSAWKHLGEAYSKSPQNPDIRTYKAQLLESVGKHNLAHNEHQAAVRLNPENVFLKDNLANFYLRQGQYPMALTVLKDSLKPPSIDKIWIEAIFWNKVTTPFVFDWEETPPPQGKLEPIVQYLLSLDKNTFWNENKFKQVHNNEYFLKTQQETFWLRLIQNLKDKNEKDAYKLLKYNPFVITSWYPELLTTLKRILTYRMNGSLKIEQPLINTEGVENIHVIHVEYPPFFKELETLANNDEQKISPELHNLLMSNEIFSALFLTIKWYEAGIDLHQVPIIPDNLPDWVAYNMTEALHHNRGTVEALEFAAVQKPSPMLSLLRGELTLAGGDSDSAVEIFDKLAKENSDVGYRAAWLASLIYIEKNDWKEAKNSIISQPRLVNDLLGKETFARIAHLEGNNALADRLYSAIEKNSTEARSYLARKAYADKNWDRARELTEQLILDHPENQMLRYNLNQIIEEQANAGNKPSVNQTND